MIRYPTALIARRGPPSPLSVLGESARVTAPSVGPRSPILDCNTSGSARRFTAILLTLSMRIARKRNLTDVCACEMERRAEICAAAEPKVDGAELTSLAFPSCSLDSFHAPRLHVDSTHHSHLLSFRRCSFRIPLPLLHSIRQHGRSRVCVSRDEERK